VFDNDQVIQPFVKSGKARLVKGDALVRDDCKKAWDEAAKGEPEGEGVDLLIFSVGRLSLVFAFLLRFFVNSDVNMFRWYTEIHPHARLRDHTSQPSHPIAIKLALHSPLPVHQNNHHLIHWPNSRFPQNPSAPHETIIFLSPCSSS
jgi:hypothetical protein